MENTTEKDNNVSALLKLIDRTDEINKRLVVALVVLLSAAILCFCVTLYGMTKLYFTTDYYYPDLEQTQTNNQQINIDKGGVQ